MDTDDIKLPQSPDVLLIHDMSLSYMLAVAPTINLDLTSYEKKKQWCFI